MTRDELLARFPDDVQAVALRLIEIVLAVMTEAEERVYTGWGGIGFRDSERGYVCGVYPQKDSVRLLFERGTLLPDPEGRLRGDGTQTRYLDYPVGAAVDEEEVARYVGRAMRC